jgi:inner membrane protein involved in colicin E2 resistance
VLFGLLAEHVSYEAAWWSSSVALALATAIMGGVLLANRREGGMAAAPL